MSAVEAINAARNAGIRLGIDGDALTLEAAKAPPSSVLDVLARHKAGIVALLRDSKDGWSGEDWMTFFKKQTRSVGALPREEAEARAFACCVAEWLNGNPVRSLPGRCLGCDDAENAHDPLLPFGTESTGHAWLHSRCWPAWHASRKAEAVAALSTFGIPEMRTSPCAQRNPPASRKPSLPMIPTIERGD